MGLRVGTWLDDRLGWSDLRQRLSEPTTGWRRPEHYLGSAALLLLGLLVLSGVLLVMHYRPSVGHAHGSVIAIKGAVNFGALVRDVHAWSSDLLVGVMAAYCFAMALGRSYRAPGELLWITGLLTLFISGLLAFSGAVLPWNQWALEQARVAGQLTGHIPLIGGWIRRMVLGGVHVSGHTIERAYGFHVAVLPAILTALVAFQLRFHQRVQRAAEQQPPSEGEQPSAVAVYPGLLLKHAIIWVALLLVVLVLATFASRGVGVAVHPEAPNVGAIHPPWYLVFWHLVVRAAPKSALGAEGAKLAISGIVVFSLLILSLPLVDRRGSKVTFFAACVTLVAMVVLTVYGLL